MPSQFSPALESRRELADAVRQTDQILMPMLQEYSQSAKALWDVGQDQRQRDVLTLAVTDPWGYAAEDFTPEELTDREHLHQRFHDLVGEMIAPRRHRNRANVSRFATLSSPQTSWSSFGSGWGIYLTSRMRRYACTIRFGFSLNGQNVTFSLTSQWR